MSTYFKWHFSESGNLQKICPECLSLKIEFAFHRDKTRLSGRHPVCIECCHSIQKKSYHQNLELSRKTKREAAVKFRKNNPDFYRNHYQRNASKICAKTVLYRSTRKEFFANYRKKWTGENKDKVRRYRKEWLKNPRSREIVSHHSKLYKYRLFGAIGSHTLKEWLALISLHSFTCSHCKKKEPEIKLTRDHVIPLSKGGSNYISNIQPLCSPCNSRKKNRIL